MGMNSGAEPEARIDSERDAEVTEFRIARGARRLAAVLVAMPNDGTMMMSVEHSGGRVVGEMELRTMVDGLSLSFRQLRRPSPPVKEDSTMEGKEKKATGCGLGSPDLRSERLAVEKRRSDEVGVMKKSQRMRRRRMMKGGRRRRRAAAR
ncbi:unnamed protein product [Linum trigynum]